MKTQRRKAQLCGKQTLAGNPCRRQIPCPYHHDDDSPKNLLKPNRDLRRLEKLAQGISSGKNIKDAGREAGYAESTLQGKIYKTLRTPAFKAIKRAYIESLSLRPDSSTGNAKADITPQASSDSDCGFLTPRVTLAQYVVLIRSHADLPFALDEWQKDMCVRLEKAFWCASAAKFQTTFSDVVVDGKDFVEAPNGFLIPKEEFREKQGLGTKAAIHAPPQFGKSCIISVCHPAWILGFDPLHRFRLATYNIWHSQKFSKAIQQILRSREHKSTFPDPKGHLPNRTRFVEWSTRARLELNDAQASFIAMGLDSGFVGSGADTLLQDDPYRSAEKARSAKIRDTTWRFQTETAAPRLREYSNNFIMFHRYHMDDQGGRAIATGKFELWRYAAISDGVYEDEESGLMFPCLPLSRDDGEYLSSRHPRWYYDEMQLDREVWNTQFQGRPTSKGGTFFDITKVNVISAADFAGLTMVHEVRAWDNAATEKSGDFTAGARVAMDAMGNYYLRNMKRAQVDTAGRQKLQAVAAWEDGRMVPIHFPQDPASAGKDVAFFFRQEYELQGYTVVVEPVTGSKTSRANELSRAVNSGKFFLVLDDGSKRFLSSDEIKAFKAELRDFPSVGLYKDQVDCTADAVTYNLKLFLKGRVVKVHDDNHLLPWSRFIRRFGNRIPGHWEVAIAARIAANSTLPSGWAMVARAAENARLGETVFVVASMRKYVRDAGIILTDIKQAIKIYCDKGEGQVQAIYVPQGHDALIALGREKYDLTLSEFEGSDEKGLPETAWYFQSLRGPNPFYSPDELQANARQAAHCYILSDDSQIENAKDDLGQLSLRQDMLHWSYNDQGKPQPFGGIVLDCVRMVLSDFWLSATALTDEERRHSQLPRHLQNGALQEKFGTDEFATGRMAQAIELGRIAEAERKRHEEERHPAKFGSRIVVRRFPK